MAGLCVRCGKQDQLWRLSGEPYCGPCLREELRPLAVSAGNEVFTLAAMPRRRKRSHRSTLGDPQRRLKWNKARQRALTRLAHLHMAEFRGILDEELAEEGLRRRRAARLSVDAIARQNGAKIMGVPWH